MGLHLSYLHEKKLTPVQIMINAGLNNKNIVNSVGYFNESFLLIKLIGNDIGMNNVLCEYSWDAQRILVHSAGSTTPPIFPNSA